MIGDPIAIGIKAIPDMMGLTEEQSATVPHGPSNILHMTSKKEDDR